MSRRKNQGRRVRNTGSISVNTVTGAIRARLPAELSADGVRKAKRFRPGREADARAWIGAMMAPEAPEPVAAPRTLEEWSVEWWETYVEGVRPPNTATTYLSHLKKLEPEYAEVLPAVRMTALQRIVNRWKSRVAAETVHAIVGVWRQCFDAAIEDELIARNPTRRLVLPKIPKTTEPRRHVSPAEVAALRKRIVGERFEVAFALMLGCGLRIGEILGLHVEHVQRVRRRIWVQHQFTNGHWRDLPKGSNPHWVPMPTWVAAIMERHLDALPEGHALILQSPHQSKQARREDKPRPWSYKTVSGDLYAIVAELGLDELTPHAGRHGLSAYLLEHGVGAPAIAERLGNTPSTILNHYSNVTEVGRQRAGEIIEQYLTDDTDDDAESDDMGSVTGLTG